MGITSGDYDTSFFVRTEWQEDTGNSGHRDADSGRRCPGLFRQWRSRKTAIWAWVSAEWCGLARRRRRCNGREDRDYAVCHQPIQDQEQWFRVYEEYVHLFCSEKYLRRVSGRRQEAKTTPEKA